jgi:hypothetical protein
VLIGDQMQRLVEMPDISVVAVKDYEVRPDGTARYVVANRAMAPGIQRLRWRNSSASSA